MSRKTMHTTVLIGLAAMGADLMLTNEPQMLRLTDHLMEMRAKEAGI